MKKLALLGLLALLCACGPREIGEGSAYEAPAGGGASGAELMRFPMTGANNTQRMLYYSNRPDVMERVQNWRVSALRQRLGVAPSPEDPAYREVPKQRSPFRQ